MRTIAFAGLALLLLQGQVAMAAEPTPRVPPFPEVALHFPEELPNIVRLRLAGRLPKEGPWVVGSIQAPKTIFRVNIENSYGPYLVWVERGDIQRWMPASAIPEGPTRRGVWWIWSDGKGEVQIAKRYPEDAATVKATIERRAGDFHKHAWEVDWQSNSVDVRQEMEAGRQINRDIDYYLTGGARNPETGELIAPLSLREALGATYRVHRELLFQLLKAYGAAFRAAASFENIKDTVKSLAKPSTGIHGPATTARPAKPLSFRSRPGDGNRQVLPRFTERVQQIQDQDRRLFEEQLPRLVDRARKVLQLRFDREMLEQKEKDLSEKQREKEKQQRLVERQRQEQHDRLVRLIRRDSASTLEKALSGLPPAARRRPPSPDLRPSVPLEHPHTGVLDPNDFTVSGTFGAPSYQRSILRSLNDQVGIDQFWRNHRLRLGDPTIEHLHPTVRLGEPTIEHLHPTVHLGEPTCLYHGCDH
jgi:hypothetical protein